MQVSIVMPAFNAERYISDAIESVLSQTYEDFEFIIIDDGSTDDTLAIARSYARQDRRGKVISQANMGIAPSLNRALDLASNEWIVVMHADDVMLPNRVERQVAFVKENPDIAVAGTGVYYIDENGRTVGRYQIPLTSRTQVQEAVERNQVIALHHPSVIMRKSVVKEVGGYRQEFWPAEDLDLWNRIAERGYVILVQPEYLLKYRKHSSASSLGNARLGVLKVSWIESCMLRRRNGQPESTWEEFLALRRQAPWWQRLNQERKDLGEALYYAAVSHFSERRHLLFLSTLLGAALLCPGFVLIRLYSRARFDILRET